MTAANQTITTSRTNLNKVWRIIQGELVEGMQFECEEWNTMDELLEEEATTWSARQVLIPIDLTEGAGIASIDEGGYEAYPSSPNLSELTVDLVQFNGRFNASLLAQYGDKPEAEIKRQIKHQGGKKIQDLARHWSDYFYGVSNAYLAQVSAALTGTTLTHTLIGGYGVSGITTASFLADKFRAGDRVALIRSSTLVSNAIGVVGAVNTTAGALTITWAGEVEAASADYVVKANSMENTTLATTDYAKGLVGLVDMTQTVTVHGVSSSSVPNWNVAYSDTSGGTMTGSRFHRAVDEIKNKGGSAGPNICFISQGVLRAMNNNERAALRVSDPFGIELDTSVKFKGLKWMATRRSIPGYAILGVKKSMKRWNLTPKPDGSFTWGDGKELIDQNAKVFRVDMPTATLIKNRRNLAYFTGLTEA